MRRIAVCTPTKQYMRTQGTPSVDVMETKEAYILEAEVPGFSQDDIEVKVEENLLTISSKEKGEQKGDSDIVYHVKERKNTGFSRSFVLPKDADKQGITASYKNGVLTLAVVKIPKAQPKKIEISIE